MSLRSRGLFQRKRARTNERHYAPPIPAPPPPPPSFHASTRSVPSSELHDLLPATSGAASQHQKLLLLRLRTVRQRTFVLCLASK